VNIPRLSNGGYFSSVLKNEKAAGSGSLDQSDSFKLRRMLSRPEKLAHLVLHLSAAGLLWTV
jgi:hypothetical protein